MRSLTNATIAWVLFRNTLRSDIDGLSLKLQESNADGDGNDGGRSSIAHRATEQEPTATDNRSSQDSSAQFLLVMQLKDAKKRYRERFERFQELKAEVNYLVKIRDQMLVQLTREFDSWKQQYVFQQCG